MYFMAISILIPIFAHYGPEMPSSRSGNVKRIITCIIFFIIYVALMVLSYILADVPLGKCVNRGPTENENV